MIPRIDGKIHHFEAKGLYDGLSLLVDYESETWWDHVTGEAVYGPLTGTQIPIFNLLHSTVEQTWPPTPTSRSPSLTAKSVMNGRPVPSAPPG